MTKGTSKIRVWASVFAAAAVVAGTSGIVTYLAVARSPSAVWVEIARNQPLQPCFKNHIFARLHYAGMLERENMSDDELAKYVEAGQVIPEGPHEGVIVPKDCFAVSDGYYGFGVTFWERPEDEYGDFDMSIPFWTGPENGLAPAASTDDQG